MWGLPLVAVYFPVHDKIRSESFAVAANISRRSGEAFNLVKDPAIMGPATVGDRCVRAFYRHLFTNTHTHTYTHTYTHTHTQYEDT